MAGEIFISYRRADEAWALCSITSCAPRALSLGMRHWWGLARIGDLRPQEH